MDREWSVRMPRQRKFIYLAADGAHARFIEQSADTGDFVTMKRLDGTRRLEILRAEQRDEGPGLSFSSAGAHRHSVGREDPYRPAKEGFIKEVAAALDAAVAQGDYTGVVLAAPQRLVRSLRECLAPGTPVVAVLQKNLVKTPDHELGKWLSPTALARAS